MEMYLTRQLVGLIFAISLWPLQSFSQDNALKSLSEQYFGFSDTYYSDLAKNIKSSVTKNTISSLGKYYKELIRNDRQEQAIAALIVNQGLIFQFIDSKESMYFLSELLEHDVSSAANKIANVALNNSSPYNQSKVNYLLARFNFRHQRYELAIKSLLAIELDEALTKTEQDYATLMFGVSLQETRKHREAIKIYNGITPESSYFSYAKLNQAVANIKQDWWTDAHIAIEQALESTSSKQFDELSNRLLVVLGYSQLKNEFYRNARKTFQRLNTNSQYVNRALLGIGLCALSQEDFVGALNAFIRLKSVESDELAVMESYILSSITYQRSGDLAKASENFTEAITYYESKSRQYEQQLSILNNPDNITIKKEHLSETQLNQEILNQYKFLKTLDLSRNSDVVKQRYKNLYRQYHQAITQELREFTKNKISQIQSYQSQSQFGLAKIYDASQ